MKNNSYRILKLKSGEELITRIIGNKNGKLIIERPMMFHSSTMTDPYGRAKEITILKNWLLYASQEKTSIPSDFVATFLKPDNDVLRLYELEKKKNDGLKHKKKNRIIKDPRTPKNKFGNFKGSEEVENMMDLFNKYYLFNKYADKDMIDDIMNKIDNMSEEEMAAIRDEAIREEEIEEEMVNYITMTLFLPPESLMTLVDSGLVDEDQIKGIIDALSEGKTSSRDDDEDFPFGELPPKMGEQNFNELFGEQFPPIGNKEWNFDWKSNKKNDNRDSDDYGKHWKDWSPYPEDYLDDRP